MIVITHCSVCERPYKKHAKPGEPYCLDNHYTMADGNIVNVPEDVTKRWRATTHAQRKANGTLPCEKCGKRAAHDKLCKKCQQLEQAAYEKEVDLQA